MSETTADTPEHAADTDGLVRIGELAGAAGVPVATVRHYLREGLLPEGTKTSPNMAWYPPELAERIRLIKQLQEERYLPLKVIRRMLEASEGAEDRMRELLDAGDRILERALAPERERTSHAEVSERFGLPQRALDRLAELGIVTPDADGYSPLDVRIISAIARFRQAGWDERTGFGARDVARLMDGLRAVIDDEIELLAERFATLGPDEAAELGAGGAAPFPDLIGALHAKLLTDALTRRR